jgi:hypothetical protein
MSKHDGMSSHQWNVDAARTFVFMKPTFEAMKYEIWHWQPHENGYSREI